MSHVLAYVGLIVLAGVLVACAVAYVATAWRDR